MGLAGAEAIAGEIWGTGWHTENTERWWVTSELVEGDTVGDQVLEKPNPTY